MTKNPIYNFETFNDGKVVHEKKKGHLPAMGWNSWNAFGSGNTEALTKVMADKMVELGLDKLGYEYVVLDDGCYKPERVEGLLSNEEVKFPSGFRALADYIHAKGLKFGMYNDIGERLCAGAWVGTCGHEKDDAKSYLDWTVDFLKVDNCYYLWDNATFSNPENAKYVFAPNIANIFISKDGNSVAELAACEGKITGERAFLKDNYVTFIGTFDGTGPDRTPTGTQSSELFFEVPVSETGEYTLSICYATGKEEGVGEFLQIAVENSKGRKRIYDDFVLTTESKENFVTNEICKVYLEEGINKIILMNHRRQENTLGSYGTLVEAFRELAPEKDLILSICEWGKTFPQDWGYKTGDSWRILNDITFRVGSDGNPGVGTWNGDYTCSVTAQYNKAVIMDEFAGLDKGWNDPDMLMIGMNEMSPVMNKSHMTLWSMMNSPLMLGLDLRRVEKGDDLYQVIANKDIIGLNQDLLGIQAKRIYSTLQKEEPDKEYIRDNKRVDVLAKPLEDGSVAITFINLDSEAESRNVTVSVDDIIKYIGHKMVNKEKFSAAKKFEVVDLWTKDSFETDSRTFESGVLVPCDNKTVRIYPRG